MVEFHPEASESSQYGKYDRSRSVECSKEPLHDKQNMTFFKIEVSTKEQRPCCEDELLASQAEYNVHTKIEA